MLILEHAVQHKELLAAVMHMWREVAVLRVADDRRGAGDLIADAVQHPAVHAGHWRHHPVQRARMDHGAPGEIRVQLHHCAPIVPPNTSG